MKNVSAAIFIKEDSVLIAKRKNTGNQAGYWEFPGGKQEQDETIFECLEREIWEEFGVWCRAGKVFCESIYFYENGAINLIAIFAELAGDEEIQLNVHDQYTWVKVEDLLKYELSPADVPVAERLVEVYAR